jgi:hypothetical protein
MRKPIRLGAPHKLQTTPMPPSTRESVPRYRGPACSKALPSLPPASISHVPIYRRCRIWWSLQVSIRQYLSNVEFAAEWKWAMRLETPIASIPSRPASLQFSYSTLVLSCMHLSPEQSFSPPIHEGREAPSAVERRQRQRSSKFCDPKADLAGRGDCGWPWQRWTITDLA